MRGGPVEVWFHPEVRYVIAGSGTAYGEIRGPAAIVRRSRRMLDEYDRKFDHRSPRLASWPRVRGGELDLAWAVRYSLRGESVVLNGRSQCRFAGGAIVELRDTVIREE